MSLIPKAMRGNQWWLQRAGWLLAAVVCWSMPAHAQLRAGFRNVSVARGDDIYTSPLALGFSVFARGGMYSTAQLCMNGFVGVAGVDVGDPVSCAFSGGLPSLRSYGTAFSVFLSDMDSTDPLSGVLGYGVGVVNGRAAWGATWDGLFDFNNSQQRTAAQLVFVDRSDLATGDFDVEYRWGDDLGGSGEAGFVDDGALAADGLPVERPVSPAERAMAQQCFRRGELSACPAQVVPEPATGVLFAVGMLTLAGVAARRSFTASTRGTSPAGLV